MYICVCVLVCACVCVRTCNCAHAFTYLDVNIFKCAHGAKGAEMSIDHTLKEYTLAVELRGQNIWEKPCSH